jgi:7-dehydrocholesterol reductase
VGQEARDRGGAVQGRQGRRRRDEEEHLLASGWWAVARHFHYLPEITASFFWTAPALFGKLPPYLYVIFLTVLLIDRSVRDDTRCSLKYGKYWKKYCELVPYKIIPGIF